jgi:hypothetical protein
MKPNFSKIRIISYTRKIDGLNCEYRLGNSFIQDVSTECIKDLGAHDCKLRFHRYVDFLLSYALKLLGLIRIIICNFSTLDSLLMLHFALV